jgi:hypothetical protein
MNPPTKQIKHEPPTKQIKHEPPTKQIKHEPPTKQIKHEPPTKQMAIKINTVFSLKYRSGNHKTTKNVKTCNLTT